MDFAVLHIGEAAITRSWFIYPTAVLAGILELLEEATRTLKDYAEFKQDPRYLKLWQMYASYVERPSIIYAFLMANEIGTTLAGLYESYAVVLERDGR